ncbi:macrophage mannose receptor 1-like [Antedon mediterranea]|uniref:macrophage mannose receptor 1-like n=1 Tax=Antedon mediterranea TaxID=105859 RepID=UPI003AF4CEA8
MGGSPDSTDFQVYTHWYGNEPNNYKFPGEDCVMLVSSEENKFKWYDTTCSNGEGYICENIPGTPKNPKGLMYSVHMDLKTWEDAETFCRDNGGRLAWVLDQDAQDYIESLILSAENGYILKSPGVWLGLNDQTSQMSFQWSDGSDVTYTNWNHDEPNNWAGASEDCVFAYTSTGVFDTGHKYYAGKWNDQNCEDSFFGYVCKKPKEVLPITLVPPTSSGCPFGWKGYGTSCYFFDSTAQSWDDGRNKCQQNLQANMVSISNRFEQAFITDQLSSLHSWYWTGFNDKSASGTYKWDDGTPVTYTNWDQGQPNSAGDSNCVALVTSKPVGFWDDMSCESNIGVICEKPRDGYTKPPMVTTQPSDVDCLVGWTGYGSHCYQAAVIPQDIRLSWEEALDVCRNMGSELASFHSNQEEEWVKSSVKTEYNMTGNFWIGLNDRDAEERYEWSDDSPVDYLPWAIGQPNNDDHTENCVEMIYDKNTNGWADNDCSVKRNWICKMKRGNGLKTTLPSVTGIVSPECGEGWVSFPGNNQCYKFYDDSKRKSWSEAEQVCIREASDLASIHSPEEMNFIRSMAAKLPTFEIWTGMRDYQGELGYQNSDGSVTNYFRWDANQPNNNRGNDRCILMSASEGKMAHESCSETRAFACKKRPSDAQTTLVVPTTVMPGYCPSGWSTRGNKCYKFFEEKRAWNDSKAFCESNNGGLVAVNDEYDQAYLITLLRDIDYPVWLGINDRDSEGMFVNADGSDLTYAHWMVTEPNGGANENCVEMYSGNSQPAGAWNDLPCSAKVGVICQRPRDSEGSPTPVGVACADGFSVFDGACYKVMTDASTFQEAEKTCAKSGGHLTSVSNGYEQNHLLLLGQDTGGIPLWIGMQYDDSNGKYTWINGWPTTYTNWAIGQPVKNVNGGCVVMLPNGRWNDTLCANKYGSICKVTDATPPVYPSIAPGNCTDETWSAYGAHCYKAFLDDQVAWHNAEYKCSVFRNTHLASVHSSKELEFINNVVVKRVPSVWIGLMTDEASGYSWSDGSPVDYLPWAPNEPTGTYEGEAEDCVETNIALSTWNDLSCNRQLGYVCKYSKYDPHTIPTGDTIKDGGDSLSAGAIIGITLGCVGAFVAVLAVIMLIKKQRRLLEYFRHSTPSDGFEDHIVGEINS